MEVGKAINDGGFLKEFSLISLKANTSTRRTKKARRRSPLRIHQRLNHEHSDRVALNWFVFNDELYGLENFESKFSHWKILLFERIELVL